jgi:hypothetical protein
MKLPVTSGKKITGKTKKIIETALKDYTDRLVFHKDGTVTAMLGYYYKNCGSHGEMERAVKAIPGVSIIDVGDHYHDFVGGSRVGSATSSYTWVKFQIKVKE